jgi:hypothetical protein
MFLPAARRTAAAEAAASAAKAATCKSAAATAEAATASPDDHGTHAAAPVLAPATIHGTEHRQKYEEDQEQNEYDRAKRNALIAPARFLRCVSYLGGFIGG